MDGALDGGDDDGRDAHGVAPSSTWRRPASGVASATAGSAPARQSVAGTSGCSTSGRLDV